MKNDILSFDKVSKKEWLDKINKDLKGKAMESLYWNYQDGFTIDPFSHEEDRKESDFPLLNTSKSKNTWNIAASFNFATAKLCNESLLKALNQGLEHAQLFINGKEDISELLDGVHLDLIKLDFVVKSLYNYKLFLDNLSLYINTQKRPLENLNIEFIWRGEDAEREEFYSISKLAFPRANYIHLSTTEKGMAELSDLLFKAYKCIKKSGDTNLGKMTFYMKVNEVFLFEIARIRAFKKLWKNLLLNMGLSPTEPLIIIVVDQDSMSDDPNDNMILNCVQAMQAAIAGVTSILISEYTSPKEDQFYSRIAMNIQHILKLESKMDIVQDPVAGSYHFEKLTTDIFNRVWNDFIAL